MRKRPDLDISGIFRARQDPAAASRPHLPFRRSALRFLSRSPGGGTARSMYRADGGPRRVRFQGAPAPRPAPCPGSTGPPFPRSSAVRRTGPSAFGGVMADIAALSDPRQHDEAVAQARNERGQQRQHGEKDGRNDGFGDHRSAQDPGEGRGHHRSGGGNVAAYIHALVQGRGWQRRGRPGPHIGRDPGSRPCRGRRRAECRGKSPSGTFWATMSLGSVQESPGAQGEIRLALLGQVFLGLELLIEMGNTGSPCRTRESRSGLRGARPHSWPRQPGSDSPRCPSGSCLPSCAPSGRRSLRRWQPQPRPEVRLSKPAVTNAASLRSATTKSVTPEGFEFGAVAGRPNHGPDPCALFEQGRDDLGAQGSRSSHDCDDRRFHDHLPPPDANATLE